MNTGRLGRLGRWLKRHWLLTTLFIIAIGAGGWWFSSGRQGEKKKYFRLKPTTGYWRKA